MSRTLDLTAQSRDGATAPLSLDLAAVMNMGSATRDPAVAKLHQDEVALHGVAIATNVPAPRLYPMAVDGLSTGTRVEVHTGETSGEVEIVLIFADQLYVGVGSDHTDRLLEKASIPYSKQACANVIAPTVWPFAEIADTWDQCILRSWVDGRLYQEVGVDAFLRPEDIAAMLADRAPGFAQKDTVAFCGTIVSVDKRLGFGSRWEFEIEDPVGGRSIRHAYDVVDMFQMIRPEYRVPVLTGTIGPDSLKT
ncbi:DUF2848 family protein [Acuticoccus sp. MNP-M23]|uniref:DUF2848 family protein n=1 Tax=Acuticoccus sp. MNP-M23 TaxID=3072793 RepID=UPI002815AB29|nr:DUF2848 family protein [Acuticoccus sp. MNP-M23]WMS42570.1 DUF2848 family protein [Acuticoccus sp. MNP-M23]